MQKNNIYIILLIGWIAVFTSQTLVDIADTITIFTALYYAIKSKSVVAFFDGFKPKLLWAIWLILLIVGASVNGVLFQEKVLLGLLEFKWILSLLSLIYLYKTIDYALFVEKYLLKLVLVLNLIALVVYFAKSQDRAAGILDQIMPFSHNIAPVFVLFSFILLFSHSRIQSSGYKKILYFVCATSALLTLLTITRGVWIAASVAIIFGIFVWLKKYFVKAVIIFTGVFILILAVNTQVRNRFLIDSSVQQGSNYIRLALYKANLEMVKDHPIFGVGVGQNVKHLPEYYKKLNINQETLISHAHNQYLDILANTGVTGLTCFLFFIFAFSKQILQTIFKITEKERDINLLKSLFLAICCFLIGALTECNFNVSKNRYFFLILVSFALAISSKFEKRKESSRK